jgi:signal transduction histidine kinase
MESLGTLSSGIAHDFNNLLAIISGYTEVCLARVSGAGADETLRRHLHEIHSATQRSAGLVQRILSFSRKAEVRLRAVSLNKVVREFGSLVGETFPRTITIDYDLNEDLPSIPADPNQLQQIIMNLCVNARDAMPKGGRLTLATRAVSGAEISKLGADPDQRYVCLRISDTGSGI